MAEYIEREALKKRLACSPLFQRIRDVNFPMKDAVIDLVERQPTADVVEVRHGEWVHTNMAASWHGKDECSECHYHTTDRVDLSCFNYCPNCGAKMDGKDGKE